MLDKYPVGPVSIVADSYNVYEFVEAIVERRDLIVARDGVVIPRPDSTTREHPTAALEVVYLLERLWDGFGGTINAAAFKVLDPHVRLLWGDGLTPRDIMKILGRVLLAGYAAENFACFGMGGGLLQKLDRDTQRFAFKSSAQKRDGVWHDVRKEPLDETKKSKAGRLQLIRSLDGRRYRTIRSDEVYTREFKSVLQTVFEDGQITRLQRFDEIRDS